MADIGASINWDKLKVGETVDTGGIFYAPYYAIECVAFNDRAVLIHTKSHKQYWGQQEHVIPASYMVFVKYEYVVRRNDWLCEKVFDKDSGRNWRKVRAEALKVLESYA